MKLIWKGNWKKGELSVETESPEELIGALERLESVDAVASFQVTDSSQMPIVEIPKISGNIGPSEAIREVLGSAWGKAEPRTMTEITDVLKQNAIYFSTSTLSGVLSNMTKKGELKRPIKKEEKWAYVLSS